MYCKIKAPYITCPSCNIFTWHKPCIERICTSFSLNIPDITDQTWKYHGVGIIFNDLPFVALVNISLLTKIGNFTYQKLQGLFCWILETKKDHDNLQRVFHNKLKILLHQTASFFTSNFVLVRGFLHFDWCFLLWESSQTFNLQFQMLNFISRDAFDFVDVDRYLQSLHTSHRSCKIVKTDLEGKKAPFFPLQVPC